MKIMYGHKVQINMYFLDVPMYGGKGNESNVERLYLMSRILYMKILL